MSDNIEQLREQLRQLEQLHAQGALGAEQYAPSRQALERRLVDAVMAAPALLPAQARPSLRLALGLGAFVLAVAVGGYVWLGTPSAIAEAPVAAASASGPEQAHALGSDEIAAMADRLAARLKDRPDDADGWAMLARSYAVVGRHADAVPAFRKARALHKDDPVLLADFADALAVTQRGSLGGEPLQLVQQALKLAPGNVKALSLAGTEAFNRKDYASAVAHWEKVLQNAPADSPFIAQVRGGIDEARQLAQGKLPAPSPLPEPLTTSLTKPLTTPQAKPLAAAAPASAAAARVSGTVTLAPALASKASPDDTVFVFARAVQGSRMPLAIVRKQVKDLPFRFELDDSMAMAPQARLSGVAQVVVGARVSKSGNASPEAGDLEGVSAPVAVGSANVAVTIRDVVAPR